MIMSLLANKRDILARPKGKPPLAHFDGWRGGVLTCAVVTFVTLLINISTSVWAIAEYHPTSGLGTIYKGNCSVTKTVSLWIHLARQITQCSVYVRQRGKKWTVPTCVAPSS